MIVKIIVSLKVMLIATIITLMLHDFLLLTLHPKGGLGKKKKQIAWKCKS